MYVSILYPPFNLLLNNPMNLLVLGTVEGRRPSLVGDVQGHPELCHQSPHTLSVTSLHGAHEATGEAAPEAKDGGDSFFWGVGNKTKEESISRDFPTVC